MVCMAIEGAMSVAGGNWQIFDGMLNASNATVHLNTTVDLIKKIRGKYSLKVSSRHHESDTTTSKEQLFDTVVLAAPFQFSDIELETDLVKRIPDKIPYVKLHVTLFTSTEKLNPIFFGLEPGAEVPDSILTTLPPDTETPNDPTEGVGPAGFFSISTLRTLVNPKTIQKEYLYKIFSPEKVSSSFLSGILGMPSLFPIIPLLPKKRPPSDTSQCRETSVQSPKKVATPSLGTTQKFGTHIPTSIPASLLKISSLPGDSIIRVGLRVSSAQWRQVR